MFTLPVFCCFSWLEWLWWRGTWSCCPLGQRSTYSQPRWPNGTWKTGRFLCSNRSWIPHDPADLQQRFSSRSVYVMGLTGHWTLRNSIGRAYANTARVWWHFMRKCLLKKRESRFLLERRRMRGDITEIHKMLHDLKNATTNFLPVDSNWTSESSATGHLRRLQLDISEETVWNVT